MQALAAIMQPNMQCNAIGLAAKYETMRPLVDTANCADYFHKLCRIRELAGFGGRSYVDSRLHFRSLFRNEFASFAPFFDFLENRVNLNQMKIIYKYK